MNNKLDLPFLKKRWSILILFFKLYFIFEVFIKIPARGNRKENQDLKGKKIEYCKMNPPTSTNSGYAPTTASSDFKVVYGNGNPNKPAQPQTFGMGHSTSGRHGFDSVSSVNNSVNPPTQPAQLQAFGMGHPTSGRHGFDSVSSVKAPAAFVGFGVARQSPHNGVCCDSCQGQVLGIRYHCTSCANFDLCSTCYEPQRKIHNHETNAHNRHLFLAIDDYMCTQVNRRDFLNLTSFSHGDLKCNTCLQVIDGYRFSCQSCPNVHLCSSCELTGLNHDYTHPLLKVLGTFIEGTTPGHGSSSVAQPPQQPYKQPYIPNNRHELGPNPFANINPQQQAFMPHFTSGRNGFEPSRTTGNPNPFASSDIVQGPPQATFGMGHVTSGRHGFEPSSKVGFGQPAPFPPAPKGGLFGGSNEPGNSGA